MKRIFILMLILALLAPSASTFAAQPDGPPGGGGFCDFDLFMEDFLSQLENASDFEALFEAIGFAVETGATCWTVWLEQLFTALMGGSDFGPPIEIVPPVPQGSSS